MTTPGDSPSPAAAEAPVGWWDRLAILALGGAGCALSYDALQQMAIAIHVRPQLSYLFPLVIDGFIAYGIRALLVLSTAPLRARLYIWTLFGTATTASIWANALHAVRLNQQSHSTGLRLSDNVVAVLSTIAPLALAGAVHLYILITRHNPAHRARAKAAHDQPTQKALVPDRSEAAVPAIASSSVPNVARPVRTLPQTHDRADERTTDRGRTDQTVRPGTLGGPADQSASGPPAGTTAADDPESDHSGPRNYGPADHNEPPPQVGTSGPQRTTWRSGEQLRREPADQRPSIQERNLPTVLANHPDGLAPEPGPAIPNPGNRASVPTDDLGLRPPAQRPGQEISAGQRPGKEQTGRPSTGPDHGPADHDSPGFPSGTSGPDQSHRATEPTDRGPADQRTNNHPAIPPETSGPDQSHRATEPTDRGPADQRGPIWQERTGEQIDRNLSIPTRQSQPPVQASDQPSSRSPKATPVDSGGEAGMEALMEIAREAALAEGRMTRRALRPYLNQAGVPISHRRFAELQQRLYADPKLAHLPRPNSRRR